MSGYVPKTDKLAVPTATVINKVIESMNNFIVNNLESSLHTSCVAVLDNDPNKDTKSEYYKAAQKLKLIASNELSRQLITYDITGQRVVTNVNVDINPYEYRILVVDPDGVVVFDSSATLDANVNSQPPDFPVNSTNHNCHKCVMATLVNSTFNLSKVLSIDTSNANDASTIGSGTLTSQLGNNTAKGTLSSKLSNNANNIHTFSEFKYSRTEKGMLLYVAVALSEGIHTIGTLLVSTKITNK